MKVLVTGGTGFIGSHTAVELLKKGFDVVIADNLSNSEEWILERIEKIAGTSPYFSEVDCCNLPELKKLFLLHSDIKAVIHFAAYKSVNESIEKPLSYYHNNLVSLINLLLCMQEFSINNLVFSSSCTVYGEPSYVPVDENHPLQKAKSPYGNTKRLCEEILEDATANGQLKAISLRYFNPVGAHPSGLLGELPQGIPNNLMPYITQTAIGKRKQLSVFGNDYDTADGTCIRDFIHVVDLALAHIAAINKLVKATKESTYEVYNVGTGRGNSVLETVKAFEKVSGVSLNYQFAPRRPGDVVTMFANTDKVNKELNWKAEFSLEDALLHAWKWEKQLKSSGH